MLGRVVMDDFDVTEAYAAPEAVAAHEPPPLVASATTINLQERRPKVPSPRQWQRRAWDMYDALGEVKYSTLYLSNSMSKLRLFAAVRPDPDADPVPIQDAEGITEADKAAAIDAVERLRGPLGSFGEILGPAGSNLTIPGECYLVGLADELEERWQIRSLDELKKTSTGRLALVDDPDQRAEHGRPLDADRDYVARLWVRHPRFAMRADSALAAVLDVCDELLDLGAAVRSIVRSRIAESGILGIASELSFGSADPTQSANPTKATGDPLNLEIYRHLTTPIKDRDSAASVVPIIIRGPADHLKDGIVHVSLDRPFDAQLETRTVRALRRLAQGLNVPIEVVLGMEDVNHWTAWQIEDSAFKAHIEPLAQAICGMLTAAFLRPVLAASGVVDPRKIVLWYDESDLVVRPLSASDVHGSVDRAIMGPAAARRRLGLSDDDAPTQEEIQILQSLRSPQNVAIPASVPNESGPSNPTPAEEEPEPAAETASGALVGAAREGESIGRRLAAIDRDLRSRLLAASDSAVSDSLRRAGARVVSKSRGRDAAIKASLANTTQERAAATLGPAVVAAMGLTEEQLLEGSFDGLRDRFDQWVERAQEASLAQVPGLSPERLGEARARFAVLRADAWTWFHSQIVEVARTRLYDPSPSAPATGEADLSVAVPFGVVREAVARAGGSFGPEDISDPLVAGQSVAVGVGTGFFLEGLLSEHGVVTEEYEWTYGPYPRTSEFEPHANLDGVRFTSFTDEQLRNPGTWPPQEYLIPGDHEGCSCDITPLTRVVTSADAPRETAGVAS